MRRPRRILPYGPAALLLEWEQRIDPGINAGVHAYATAIRPLDGVIECVPAYASLLITFKSAKVSMYDLREIILDLPVDLQACSVAITHDIPVCYEAPFAPDLAYVANQCALSIEQVISLHSRRSYQVYLIGFRPGFAFMGEVDPVIQIARRDTPRTRVPTGAVGLAGGQTGIYPDECPGGWQLIGRCPLPLLSPDETDTRFRAGDRVNFHPVAIEEYHHLLEFPSPWPQR